jgi:hypothetical protein
MVQLSEPHPPLHENKPPRGNATLASGSTIHEIKEALVQNSYHLDTPGVSSKRVKTKTWSPVLIQSQPEKL